MTHYGKKGLIYLLFSYLIIVASTCVENAEPGLTAEDFTKEKRELFGDLLMKTIEQTPETFRILNRQSKRDSVILTYLQTLYDQATQEIRQDRQSISSNHWSPERKWRVVVLEDKNRYAFSLPGGHFYISTGFLASMNKGYEVYYLMAFEAASVEERFLIDNLIAQYGTTTLINLIESSETVTNPSLISIAHFLKKDLTFTDDLIKEIDKKTGELICETSIFNRFGITPLLESLTSQEQWRDTRPSYSNRLEYISSLNIEGCGTIKSTGLYERMVLKNLPK